MPAPQPSPRRSRARSPPAACSGVEAADGARAGGRARGQPGDGGRRLPHAQAAWLRDPADRARGTSVAPLRRCGSSAVARSRRACATSRAATPTRAVPTARRALSPRRSHAQALRRRDQAARARRARRADFAGDGIGGDIAVTGGALDAIERALQTELGPATGSSSKTRAGRGSPTSCMRSGCDRARRRRPARARSPTARRAPRAGARAVIATPRGQNPTGAASTPARGSELRAVLASHPTCS